MSEAVIEEPGISSALGSGMAGEGGEGGIRPKAKRKLVEILQAEGGWEEFCKRVVQEPHPIYPSLSKENVINRLLNGQSEGKVLGLLEARRLRIHNEKVEPIAYGWESQAWKEADKLWAQGRELLILGGNRCLGGDTLIYDPVLDVERPVSEIRGQHSVLTLTESGETKIGIAGTPFVKGVAELFEVLLSNGARFTATKEHLLLSDDSWVKLDYLYPYTSGLRGVGGNRIAITDINSIGLGDVWDFEVPGTQCYFAAGVLHHNSSKSTYAAKRCVEQMMRKPGSVVWCFSTSFETSVRDQQRMIWLYLPQLWRAAKKTRFTNISYTQKRGFSDKVFITPNGSECRFMNYMQDSDVIEGGQVDLWWADELIPSDWIVTMRSRTVDRRGRGLVTQTPIKGYTQTVAEYLNGARVIEWADCELLPNQAHWPGGKPGKVPYKMQCLNPLHRVMFFHSKNNPYVPYEELIHAWKDKGSASILCRLYGVTTGISNCKFPRFGSHNIVKESEIPKKGTNYQVIDFSWSKPWAMLWAKVHRQGDRNFIYIYREWPDADSYGEWVLRSDKADGTPGPAQQPCGFGINDYKRVIFEQERFGSKDPEPVYARYGDPRSGAATALADEGATTIFQLLEKEAEGSPSIIVEPVAGTEGNYHVLEGVNLINTWLEYNVDQPIGPLNCPALYISEKCQNLIDCVKMWTGADKDKGASKDFIDLLRYLAMMEPEDLTETNTVLYEGSSY